MRYLVRHAEIRSENAAKPPSAASKRLLAWIRRLPPEAIGLDLGCGKLRYTIPLSKRIAVVSAVDSEIQLNREQRIGHKVCSVREYAADCLANVNVYSVDDPAWMENRYDVILCSNVLSAIPKQKVRLQLLRAAHDCLRAAGIVLITTQYRNTHFSSWKSHVNAKPFLDGYIVRGPKGTSFYGMLDARALERLCKIVGFEILDFGHVGETAFVLSRRRSRSVAVHESIRVDLNFLRPRKK
jgi:SAM-dependent methyltransferase